MFVCVPFLGPTPSLSPLLWRRPDAQCVGHWPRHCSSTSLPPTPRGRRQAMLKYSSTETSALIPPGLQPPSISIILQLAIQALSNSTNRLHKCHNLNSCPGRSTFRALSSTIIVSVMQRGMIALLERCCSRVPLCRFLTVSLWENDTSSAHSAARERKTNRLKSFNHIYMLMN